MVYIVQCLCPQRHCLMAVATDQQPIAAELRLRAVIEEVLRRRKINPWCAICGEPSDQWRYETGVTQFRTMAEAQPELARLAEENRRTHDELKASGRAFDSPKRHQN